MISSSSTTTNNNKTRITLTTATTLVVTIMFSLASRRTVAAFAGVGKNTFKTAQRSFGGSPVMFAKDGQAEVILVGCGAPNRGMGWYHAIQMLEEK